VDVLLAYIYDCILLQKLTMANIVTFQTPATRLSARSTNGCCVTMGEEERSSVEVEGSGASDLCPGILWAVIWCLLIFPALSLAFIIDAVYIILLPFSTCIEALDSVEEALLKTIQLPKTCAKNMIAMKPLCG